MCFTLGDYDPEDPEYPEGLDLCMGGGAGPTRPLVFTDWIEEKPYIAEFLAGEADGWSGLGFDAAVVAAESRIVGLWFSAVYPELPADPGGGTTPPRTGHPGGAKPGGGLGTSSGGPPSGVLPATGLDGTSAILGLAGVVAAVRLRRRRGDAAPVSPGRWRGADRSCSRPPPPPHEALSPTRLWAQTWQRAC